MAGSQEPKDIRQAEKEWSGDSSSDPDDEVDPKSLYNIFKGSHVPGKYKRKREQIFSEDNSGDENNPTVRSDDHENHENTDVSTIEIESEPDIGATDQESAEISDVDKVNENISNTVSDSFEDFSMINKSMLPEFERSTISTRKEMTDLDEKETSKKPPPVAPKPKRKLDETKTDVLEDNNCSLTVEVADVTELIVAAMAPTSQDRNDDEIPKPMDTSESDASNNNVLNVNEKNVMMPPSQDVDDNSVPVEGDEEELTDVDFGPVMKCAESDLMQVKEDDKSSGPVEGDEEELTDIDFGPVMKCAESDLMQVKEDEKSSSSSESDIFEECQTEDSSPEKLEHLKEEVEETQTANIDEKEHMPESYQIEDTAKVKMPRIPDISPQESFVVLGKGTIYGFKSISSDVDSGSSMGSVRERISLFENSLPLNTKKSQDGGNDTAVESEFQKQDDAFSETNTVQKETSTEGDPVSTVTQSKLHDPEVLTDERELEPQQEEQILQHHPDEKYASAVEINDNTFQHVSLPEEDGNENKTGMFHTAEPNKISKVVEEIKDPHESDQSGNEDDRPPTPPPKSMVVLQELQSMTTETMKEANIRSQAPLVDRNSPFTGRSSPEAEKYVSTVESIDNTFQHVSLPEEDGNKSKTGMFHTADPNKTSKVVEEIKDPHESDQSENEDDRPPTPPPKSMVVLQELRSMTTETMSRNSQLTGQSSPKASAIQESATAIPPQSLSVSNDKEKSHTPAHSPSVERRGVPSTGPYPNLGNPNMGGVGAYPGSLPHSVPYSGMPAHNMQYPYYQPYYPQYYPNQMGQMLYGQQAGYYAYGQPQAPNVYSTSGQFETHNQPQSVGGIYTHPSTYGPQLASSPNDGQPRQPDLAKNAEQVSLKSEEPKTMNIPTSTAIQHEQKAKETHPNPKKRTSLPAERQNKVQSQDFPATDTRTKTKQQKKVTRSGSSSTTSKSKAMTDTSASGKKRLFDDNKQKKQEETPKTKPREKTKEDTRSTPLDKHKETMAKKPEEAVEGPCAIFVKGLDPSAVKSMLINLFEICTGQIVIEERLMFNYTKTNAVIVVDGKPDIQMVRNTLADKSAGKRCPEVMLLERPTCIAVSSEEGLELSEALALYFESQGKCDVEEKKTRESDDGSCIIIQFTDPSGVERVCNMTHELDKKELRVSEFYSCELGELWDIDLHKLIMPEPIEIEKSPACIELLQRQCCSSFRDDIVDEHCEIDFTPESIRLTCTLEPSVLNFQQLKKGWTEKTKEIVNDYLRNELQENQIVCDVQIWENLAEYCRQTQGESDDVVIHLEDASWTVQLVGVRGSVSEIYDDVTAKQTALMKKFTRTEDKLVLTPLIINLMEKRGLFTRFQDGEDLLVYHNKSTIFIQGQPEETTEVKLTFLEVKGKIQKKIFKHNWSRKCKELVQSKVKIKEALDKCFSEKQIEVEWKVEDDTIIAYYFESPGLEDSGDYTYCAFQMVGTDVENTFQSMIVEKKKTYSMQEGEVMKSKEWADFEQDMTETNDMFAYWDIDHSKTEVHIFGLKPNVEDIERNVQQCLAENTLFEKLIPKGTIEIKFIKLHQKDLTKQIEDQLKKHQVSITLEYDTALIKGTREGVEAARKELDKFCKTIIHDDLKIEKVAVKDVFHDERRTGKIEEIEKTTGCLIKLPGENETYDVSSEHDYETIADVRARQEFGSTPQGATAKIPKPVVQEQESWTFKTSNGGMTVNLVEGEIGKQKGDVVVVTTAPNLSLKSGNAGKSILMEAGQELQDELTAAHQEDIPFGTIAVGNGYKARFKKAYVTALPPWHAKDAKQLLYKFVTDCLELAIKFKTRSILFCAIGCGQLNYPCSVVAEQMFQAVIDFDQKHPQSTLNKVNFVLYQRDRKVIGAFREELKLRVDGGGKRKVYEMHRGVAKIQLTVSDLATTQVDVLVCTTSSTMDMNHGACKALLHIGGKGLQEECAATYNNKLEAGQVAEITPGNLPIKALFLTVLPNYSEDAEKVLKKVLNACLNQAEAKGYTSIAFPALGTGNLRYPKDSVCSWMYDTVTAWGIKQPEPKTLKTIQFVLHPKDHDLVERFRNRIQKAKDYGNRKNRTFNTSGTFDFPKKQFEPQHSASYKEIDNGYLINGTKLLVFKGDILDYNMADAIVVSVGKNFEMTGALAQKLKKKCPKLGRECERPDQVQKLSRAGVVRTGSYGLKQKHIFHLRYADKIGEWTPLIKKTVQKADEKKVKTLAFPALGTGQGQFSPGAVCGCMFDAIKDLGHLQNIKEIHIVIFNGQSELYPPICASLQQKVREAVDSSKGGVASSVAKGVKWMYKSAKDMLLSDDFEGVATDKEIKERMEARSSMTVTIYSNEKNKIAKCKEELKRHLEEAYSKQRITEYKDLLKSLEIGEEKALDSMHLADIKIDKTNGIITIEGPKQQVFDAKSELVDKLRHLWKNRKDKEHAASLEDMVQWNCQEITQDGTELIPYEGVLNFRIEMAYQDGKKTFRFHDDDKKEFEIDFENLQEYPVTDSDNTVVVIRKDILKAKLVELPPEWIPMDNANIRKAPLNKADKEYQDIEQRFLHEVKNGKYKDRVQFTFDPSKVSVSKIERVQNKTLYAQYNTKKIDMGEQKPNLPKNMPIERELWHGTNKDAMDSIIQHGFNRSYSGNNASQQPWYGEGVYFAKDASYSVRGWMTGLGKAAGSEAQLFLVKVLTGQYVMGTKGMRVLPPIDPKKPLVKYDCSVDNVNDPYEFCIFHDTQAYPAFIITFKV